MIMRHVILAADNLQLCYRMAAARFGPQGAGSPAGRVPKEKAARHRAVLHE